MWQQLIWTQHEDRRVIQIHRCIQIIISFIYNFILNYKCSTSYLGNKGLYIISVFNLDIEEVRTAESYLGNKGLYIISVFNLDIEEVRTAERSAVRAGLCGSEHCDCSSGSGTLQCDSLNMRLQVYFSTRVSGLIRSFSWSNCFKCTFLHVFLVWSGPLGESNYSKCTFLRVFLIWSDPEADLIVSSVLFYTWFWFDKILKLI